MDTDNSQGVIDHKYRICSHIGGGGFSEVYCVEGPSGECALKLLKNVSVARSQGALAEFKNEFSVLKNLSHPHIAGILDFGFDEERARYYYTSEIIRGATIFDATEGLSIGQITDLMVQALRALEYLHSHNIHHFDIKSANVLVMSGDDPAVKLIDFGLAGIDPRGRLIGTPSYMSPEIVNREAADGRADLYSLGVLWYFCVTRFNPFRDKQPQETLKNQVHLVPAPPSTFNKNVPPWLDAVIGRLLEKNPAKRYIRAARVIREINRFIEKPYPLETHETLVSYLPREGELIGRREEMNAVRARLGELREGRARSDFVLVEGAYGTGKTRLIREFKYEAQLADVRVVMASAADADEYGQWSEALAKHIGEGLGPGVFILDDAEALAGDEGASQRLMRLLSRTRRPAGNASVLVLAAVTADHEAFAGALNSLAGARIRLSNFSPEELTAYLASLTGLDEPPQSLVDGIYRRTEGNPLFVTEVLTSLITGGGLFDAGGRWRATVFEDVGVDYSKVRIPATIGELLLERVTAWGGDERTIIEALAVVARPSTGEQIAAYADIADPFPALKRLALADIVGRSEDHRFSLKNELMAQTLYASLDPVCRRVYHDRIAAALEARGATSEEVQHHVSHGSDPARARAAALALGAHFLRRGIGADAVRYLERAAALISADETVSRIEVLLKYAEALLITRDCAGAEARFAEVEGLLTMLPSTEEATGLRVDTLIRLGATYTKMLSFGRARAAFTKAKTMLHTQIRDRVQELRVENFLGGVLMSEGRVREARGVFEGTRGAWRKLDIVERARVTNNDLGMALMAMGDLDGAHAAFEEDHAFATELGDDLLIGRALYNRAQLAMAGLRPDDAVTAYTECVEVCRRSGNTELMLRAYNGLGNIFQSKGETDTSIAWYERGLALHERAGDMRSGAAISINIGIIESARRNFDAALDRLVPAVEFLAGLADKTAADWSALARGLLELGDVHRQCGDFERATGALNQAYDIAVSHESASRQRFWILSTLADVARDRGDDRQRASLVAQMKPIAAGDDERKRLAEVSDGLSHDAVSARSYSAPRPADEAIEAPKSGPADDPLRRKRASPLEKVLEINKLINAERELDYVLKTVVYYALDLAGAESGAIILINAAGETVTACQRNMDGREDEVAFSKSLARRVLEEGRVVVTDNAIEDARFSGEESIVAHRLISIMCLPVRAKGKVIGVLYLDHRFSSGAFTNVDMRIIEAFADQAGLAIENARMVGELNRRREELSAELSAASVRIEQYEEMLKQHPSFDRQHRAGGAPPSAHPAMDVGHSRGREQPRARAAAIDEANAYDATRTWHDYERAIVAKAYQASGFHAVRAAALLGISSATMYKRIRAWQLDDRANSLYADPFTYAERRPLADYRALVFKAALAHAGGRAMRAVVNLGVSQGNFYKVMRAFK